MDEDYEYGIRREFQHTRSLYWYHRAMWPLFDFHDLDVDGRVHGYKVCLSDGVAKVNAKRKADHIAASTDPRNHSILWC